MNTDGLSFYNELIGEEIVNKHEFVVYSSFTGPMLITKEGWKVRTYLKKNLFELYYLPDDYREEHDLSQQYPKKIKALKKELLNACGGDFNNGLYSNGKNLVKTFSNIKK